MHFFRPFVLAGAALLVAWPLAAQDRRADGGRERIDTTFAFRSTGTVELSLPAGQIRVTGWARDEIRVVASTERGVIVPRFSATALTLEARSVNGRIGETRYELSVPVGVRVAARAVSGAITVSGTRGEVYLQSTSGSVEASDVTRRVEIETVSGRVTVQRADGDLDISTVSGSMDLDEVRGELQLRTVSGRTRVDRADVTGLRVSGVSGLFEFAGTLGGGRHSIDMVSGSVNLRVPANFPATIEFSTFSGELNPVGFPVTVQSGPGGGRGRGNQRLQVALNGGGTRIAIRTLSGDAVIRRLDAGRDE